MCKTCPIIAPQMQHSLEIAKQYTLKEVGITNANGGEPARQRGCWGTGHASGYIPPRRHHLPFLVDFHAFGFRLGVFILALLSVLIWSGALWPAHSQSYRHKAWAETRLMTRRIGAIIGASTALVVFGPLGGLPPCRTQG